MFLKYALALVSLLCLPAFCAEQPNASQPPVVPMRVTSVAAFKNGLAFVVKQGSAALSEGLGRIVGVPQATLGSLWLAAAERGTVLEEVVAYRYSVPRQRTAASLAELLHANIGKRVTVTFANKDYTGEIVALTEQQPPKLAPHTTSEIAPPAPYRPKVLLLKTGEQVIAMNIDSIVVAAVPAAPLSLFSEQTDETALRFRIKGAAPTTRLTMGYLEEGIGWTPSYLIRLKDDKTAEITMQATFVNDVEDLDEANVYFVVGAPNFAYANRLSPMALQQSLIDFMRNSYRRDGADFASNAIATQAVAGAPVYQLGDSISAAVSDLSGAPEQDMFLYNVPKITLAKGERGAYNVFAAEVPYEHLYEWEVQQRGTVDVYGNPRYNEQQSSSQRTQDAVWHSLVLKNRTNYPWTTAPAMVVSGDTPTAQDTIRYTPKGAPSNLKLTIATDVRTSKKEVEVERRTRAAQFYGSSYDVVTVEGTLSITNYKAQSINIHISKQLVGDVITSGENSKVVKTAEELRGVNPNSHITWELTLSPGGEKTILYRYQVFVRD